MWSHTALPVIHFSFNQIRENVHSDAVHAKNISHAVYGMLEAHILIQWKKTTQTIYFILFFSRLMSVFKTSNVARYSRLSFRTTVRYLIHFSCYPSNEAFFFFFFYLLIFCAVYVYIHIIKKKKYLRRNKKRLKKQRVKGKGFVFFLDIHHILWETSFLWPLI